MIFRQVKTALQTMLADGASAGGYQVIGYQREIRNAEEILDGNRTVQVFYASGTFPKNKGSLSGPVMHEISFRVELYVSKRAEGDLATLNNPGSDDAARAAALAGFTHAAQLADESMDELIDRVYTLIMNVENLDFGRTLPEGIIADRWISNIQKDSPIGDGEFAGLTALVSLTCAVSEDLQGSEGLEMTEGVDTEYSINKDRNLQPIDESTPIAGQVLAK